ncbi:MAG: hypothetical protein LBQ64_03015, partial [Bacteroidales bacterium]|nr:hypothetical protein [Bacteroidales bacterium]
MRCKIYSVIKLLAFFILFQLFACQYIQQRYNQAASVMIADSIIQPTAFYPDTFDQQGRLYYYIKVFGVLKYFLADQPPQDVNALFLERYQEIKDASDKASFNQSILKLLFTVH